MFVSVYLFKQILKIEGTHLWTFSEMHTHHLQTRYAALVTTLVSNRWILFRITTNRDLFTEDCFSLYHCNSQELELLTNL